MDLAWISPVTIFKAIFQNDELRYLGTEAPNINPDTPTDDEKNVVVETCEYDGFAERLPMVGFYLVVGVRPVEAKARLTSHRNQWH